MVKREVAKRFYECKKNEISRKEFFELAIPFVVDVVSDLVSKKIISKQESEDAFQYGIIILLDWLNSSSSHSDETQASFFSWKFKTTLEKKYKPNIEKHETIENYNIFSIKNLEDRCFYSNLKEKIEEVLETLTDRERMVIELRYGIKDGYQRTLEEVAKEFNVTVLRIRQIEAKAFRKLRHPSRSRKIKDFLYEF